MFKLANDVSYITSVTLQSPPSNRLGLSGLCGSPYQVVFAQTLCRSFCDKSLQNFIVQSRLGRNSVHYEPSRNVQMLALP